MNYLKGLLVIAVLPFNMVRAEPDVTVSGATYNSGAVVNEWAQYTVQTGGTVTVKNGANVTFSAGSQITLYPGFSVEPGGTFKASASALPSYSPGGYYTGITPTLVIVSGNQQCGAISQFNLQPFDIAVWNTAGTAPLINAPVLLTVSIGGGWLATTNDTNAVLSKNLQLLTDSEGTVRAYYKHGPTVGVTSYIQAVAGTQTLQLETYSSQADTTAPSVPVGLAFSQITASSFTLNWGAATDNIAVTGYDIFQDGVQVGSSVTLNYAVTGLAPLTAYSMTVKAKDAAGNVSAASAAFSVTTTADTTAPAAPSGLAAASLSATSFMLSWNASTDNIGVTGYDIFKDGVQIGSSATLTYAVSGLAPLTSYSMTVKAKDAAGNVSAASTPLSVTTTADVAAPSAPAGLVASALGTTTFTLSWNAASDDVAVTGYDVYKNGTLVGSSVTLSYAVTGLSPGTAYNMTVKAKDAANNASAASATLVVTTSTDSQAPTVPSGLAASSLGTTGFTLSWTASTDNIAVTGYNIFQDGVQIGTSATLSYAVSGLTPATVYSMTVKARDEAGNVSAASTALPVTTLTPPDTTAPSAPTNLTSSLITATSFTLTWTAATDNVGVAEYVVYQDNAQVGSPVTATSLGVSGLTAGAAYSMTVKARDAAGNVSAASQALTVTTQSAAPSTAAWETAFFGATGVNFSANPDGDALTNLQEYEQGRHPLVSDDGIDFYVDAVLGNDATYNGHSVWPGQPTAAHGPKATLTAAITAAATGDSILILSDPSGYQATTLSLTGKNLVLRPVGNVIIHP
jgi:chitodextrinase